MTTVIKFKRRLAFKFEFQTTTWFFLPMVAYIKGVGFYIDGAVIVALWCFIFKINLNVEKVITVTPP